MALTDIRVRNLQVRDKVYRVADGNGLAIEVSTAGSKLWRHRYRYNGKAQMMSLGKYPEVSLAKARELIATNRQLLREGVDPRKARVDAQHAQLESQRNTFETVSSELLLKLEREGKKPRTLKKARTLLAAILPDLGSLPISEITTTEMRTALERPQRRGAHVVAKEAKALASKVFQYAISMGKASNNPTFGLDDFLISPPVEGFSAITNLPELLTLIKQIKEYAGEPAVRNGLLILAHTFVRPGELRLAKWEEIDFEQKLWSIPGTRMKMGLDHVVPLTTTVVHLLQEIHKYRVSDSFVMGSTRAKSGVISDMTFNKALRSLGYDGSVHVAHGFRKSASTILNEKGWNYDWIERQLSHVPGNKVRRTYNKAKYLEGRRTMMNAWSEMLESAD